jgi:hypothetical protein
MVPEGYSGYFAAGASSAAALVGLLFVAISLRPDSVFGDNARAGGRALAGSTFTSLINAFFLSFLALIPGIDLGYPAFILALLCLYQTVRLHRRLNRTEAHPVLLALSLASFGGELVASIVLILNPHGQGAMQVLVYLVVASFSVALSRAWALIQGRHIRPDDQNSVAAGGDLPGS